MIGNTFLNSSVQHNSLQVRTSVTGQTDVNSSLMCSIVKGVLVGDSKISSKVASGMLQTVPQNERDDLGLIWVENK